MTSLNRDRDATRRELGQVDRGQHTDGQRHRGRDTDDQSGPDECVRDAAARLPKSACGFVKKSQLSAPAARAAQPRRRRSRAPRLRASAAKVARTLHHAVDEPAPAKPSVGCKETGCHGDISAPSQRIETADDHLGDEVGDQAEHEQDRRQVEERRRLEARACALIARGDLARERVAGGKSDQQICVPPPITCVTAIASPSARPSPRIIAAATPVPRRRQDHAAHHLPPRRAERQRAFLELVGHAKKSSRQMLRRSGRS